MINLKKFVVFVLVVTLVGFLIWYFSKIVIYVLTAIMLSFIGSPLQKLIKRIKIKNYQISNSLAASVTLLLLISIVTFLIATFVPIIIDQANILATLDFDNISRSIESRILPFEEKLIELGLLNQNQQLISIVTQHFYNLITDLNINNILANLISLSGNIFIGVFAVIFTTFFLLKDDTLVYNSIMLLTPMKYQDEMNHILKSSKTLLSRYFIGLSLEIILITTLYTIGLSIFGIRNALLIASVGGVLHVIPYLGPLIGIIFGILYGIATALSINPMADITPIVLIVSGVFITVNLIDNYFMQPYIYSSSVKAHPLEIFFTILIFENIAGIPGMILAIPVYTLLRIVLKEFLNKFRVVQKLTEKI